MEQQKPESLGLSPTRLERLTQWTRDQVNSERLAGCSVMVARHGAIGYEHHEGFADKGIERPFERDTIVRIYSMTKPITTVAAMMLYERGCFQLDARVSDYIPAFADTPVWTGGDLSNTEPQRSPMLVRHLMSHTSGLTYGFMQANEVDAAYRANGADFFPASKKLSEVVDGLASIPLLSQPGSQWNYSVSTDVLGRLVEIWSGMSLEAFFQQEIFKPLGMHDTGFYVQPVNHGRFAALYVPSSGETLGSIGNARTDSGPKPTGYKEQESASQSPYLSPVELHSGGGGLTSTLDDYITFCQMLLSGGALDGVRLLSPKTVQYMRTNQLPGNRDMAAMGQPVWSETSYEGIGFGLGFAVVLDPVAANVITSPGEHHWGGAASTFFWIDPMEDLVVVFFTQLMPSSMYPLRRELRVRVYQSIVE